MGFNTVTATTQKACNYRLTHSVSELSGFTCTTSLTMNDNFNPAQGIAECGIENFIVSE